MKCTFCKRDYEIPFGMTIIQKDGTIKYFCSSKCRKNSVMGRDNKKVGWVVKMTHNKAKAEEVKASSVARQEKAETERKAANIVKAERKSAKADKANAKEAKK